MDILHTDIPAAGDIQRMLVAGLLCFRHFAIGQNAAGNRQVVAIAELKTTFLLPIHQSCPTKIDLHVFQLAEAEQTGKSIRPRCEFQCAAASNQFGKSRLNRPCVVGNTIAFGTEFADVQHSGHQTTGQQKNGRKQK